MTASVEFFRVVSRSSKNANARVGHQVSVLLADLAHSLQGGGEAGAVPRTGDTTHPADPQHGNHDGHIRVDSIPSH